ncbi:Probable isoprenylcysteine alpha-carbonyl methylesterase icmel1 [Dionaea muscipula]
MKSQSPILPITNPSPSSSSSSSSLLSSSSNTAMTTTTTMLLQKTNDINLQSSHLFISTPVHADGERTNHEKTPLLSRTLSYTAAGTTAFGGGGGAGGHQQRRRRTASEESLFSIGDHSGGGGGGDGGQSLGQNVGHAAAQTYLVTRLCLSLLRYLGVGYRWITRFLALSCYAILLMPGFFQVGCYYFFSSQIRRGIVYGDQPRNRLDLYLPKNRNGKKPVVAFITGGAWIIGYKAWGSLLGQQLSERDVIVACIDYRNFPQGTISDMVEDASRGISYVFNNIAEFGGDPNKIYLMGQSAGAHIAACALVEQAIRESGGESVSWSVSQLKAYFGLSGGYNLFNLVDHFHSRGLYRSLFLSIMKGEHTLPQYSPEIMVRDPDNGNAVSLLPPVVLFHGIADYSIPSDSSKSFAETLNRLGAKAEVMLYEGKTHTDLFIQDPMRGGRDEMFEDLIRIIHADDEEALAKDVVAPPRRRMVPEFMLQWARSVSPF